MDEKKLQELMNDEEFIKRLATLKTESEIQKAFKSKGLDISSDEIKELSEEGKKALEDGELENVSGGGVLVINGKSVTSGESVLRDFCLGYRAGLTGMPMGGVGEDVEAADVGYVAGRVTPWVLGVSVCGGLAYKAIKKVAKNRFKDKLVAMRFDDQRRL